uniref:Uncharacterized protein n=1 Tax=Crocodylus porosus TaxID=8502 RepID=A0A7M4EZT1_CROPO
MPGLTSAHLSPIEIRMSKPLELEKSRLDLPGEHTGTWVKAEDAPEMPPAPAPAPAPVPPPPPHLPQAQLMLAGSQLAGVSAPSLRGRGDNTGGGQGSWPWCSGRAPLLLQ